MAALTLAQDMMMLRLLEQWQAAQQSVPDVAATVLLLKSWARSRGFSAQPDAFNGFLLTMLAVHLVEGGNLVRQASCELNAAKSDMFRSLHTDVCEGVHVNADCSNEYCTAVQGSHGSVGGREHLQKGHLHAELCGRGRGWGWPAISAAKSTF